MEAERPLPTQDGDAEDGIERDRTVFSFPFLSLALGVALPAQPFFRAYNGTIRTTF